MFFFNKKSEPSFPCFATGNILVQMDFIITGHYPEVAIMVFGIESLLVFQKGFKLIP